MLLEFAVSNYKNFKEEVVFSMIPNNRIHDLDYSILKDEDSGIRALSSAVIYGPNASGKTNLIGALETLKYIINRGNIKNADTNIGSPNIAKTKLEFIPNFTCNINEPVKFRIKFLCNKKIVEYVLNILLGDFMNDQFEREVENEILKINDKVIFERKIDDYFVSNLKIIENYLPDGIIKQKDTEKLIETIKGNLVKQDLFLCSQFKNIYSSRLVEELVNWFSKKLIVIYSCNELMCLPQIKKEKNAVMYDETLNSALEIFGSRNVIGFVNDNEEENEVKPISLIPKNDDNDENSGIGINSDFIESLGTMRFLNTLPVLFEAFTNGSTLVIDEFDASIHPMALMNIINIFHNDDLNINGAQLIFNTHNPVFLSGNLFRRDEIKFMEYNDERKTTEHYSLNDFGTQGESGVRGGENYLHHYFINKYGAIKDVDFTEIFERIIGHR